MGGWTAAPHNGKLWHQLSVDKFVLMHREPRPIRAIAIIVRFVFQQTCLACSRQPCDAHHLRFVQNRAARPPDWRLIFIEDTRSITVIAVGNRREIYD